MEWERDFVSTAHFVKCLVCQVTKLGREGQWQPALLVLDEVPWRETRYEQGCIMYWIWTHIYIYIYNILCIYDVPRKTCLTTQARQSDPNQVLQRYIISDDSQTSNSFDAFHAFDAFQFNGMISLNSLSSNLVHSDALVRFKGSRWWTSRPCSLQCSSGLLTGCSRTRLTSCIALHSWQRCHAYFVSFFWKRQKVSLGVPRKIDVAKVTACARSQAWQVQLRFDLRSCGVKCDPAVCQRNARPC